MYVNEVLELDYLIEKISDNSIAIEKGDVSATYTNLNDHIDDWTHFVGVFDKTEKSVELYRNGESVGLDKIQI